MKKTRILIIEDNEDIRESTTEILELAGYEVFQAHNGRIGIDVATAHLPDIILCDIMMPELDGYSVLYMLNKHPKTAAIPFIFLTAKAERIDMRKGMEMGADDYLTKPFDDVELLNAIEIRLSKKDRLQRFYSQSLDKLSNLLSGTSGIEELQKLIADRKVRTVKKRQVIYYEGDDVMGIYLVLSGRVKTVKMSIDGRELLTGIYTTDDYVGIPALLSHEEYSETAEALEDSTICLLPKEMVEELLNKFPEVTKQFIHILSNNLLDREEQLLQLAYHSVRKRMAEVLIRLCRQEKPAQIQYLKISRDDLAAMAGMATETVSRILSDFRDEQILDKKGNQIVVLDEARLQNVKN